MILGAASGFMGGMLNPFTGGTTVAASRVLWVKNDNLFICFNSGNYYCNALCFWEKTCLKFMLS